MSDIRFLQGDCREVLKGLPADSFDSLVTDPPAGIGMLNQEWDEPEAGLSDRAAFTNFITEVAVQAYRVLKPGAYGFVWALPRTSHWTGWGLESAGFEVRDFASHIYSQGYLKNHASLKPAHEVWWLIRKPGPKVEELQLEACKVQGRFPPNLGFSHLPECIEHGTKEVKGQKTRERPPDPKSKTGWGFKRQGGEMKYPTDADGYETVPNWDCATVPSWLCSADRTHASSLGTALGSLASICSCIPLRDKPCKAPWRVRAEHARNADRLQLSELLSDAQASGDASALIQSSIRDFQSDCPVCSRFYGEPAQRVVASALDGLPSLRDALVAVGSDLRELGHTPGRLDCDHLSNLDAARHAALVVGVLASDLLVTAFEIETHTSLWDCVCQPCPVLALNRQVPDSDRFFYVGKPDQEERNMGCTDLYWKKTEMGHEQVDFVAWSALPEDLRAKGNFHISVKPIGLMRQLVRIITPPSGQVLDCFAGSGTTALACVHEDFGFVGIERESCYMTVATKRVAAVQERIAAGRRQLTLPFAVPEEKPTLSPLATSELRRILSRSRRR